MQAGPSTYRRQHWQQKPKPNDNDSGSDYDTDSSSDVTEDEEGADLTPALDAAILRTLGKIRRGEGVYSGENVLASELEEAEAEARRRGVVVRAAKVESKPFLLADHHRNALLSGQNPEDLDLEEQDEGWTPTYAQEQRKLRKEAIEAFHAFEEDDDGEGEAGFVPVKKREGKEGEGKEDEEYRKFLLEMGGGEEEVRRLLGMGDQGVSFVRADAEDEESGNAAEGAGEVPGGRKESEKKRKKKAEKKAKEDDEFLMNFILNRGWVEKEDGKNARVDDSTMDERREDEDDEDSKAGPSHPWGLLDEDEFDEKADEFEAEYNFRFEEPGSTEISTHPRQIDSLVRRPDDARKLKRQARAERKAAEKLVKEEEARKVKGKKRREMDSQLAALRKEVGEKEWAKVESVLEGEFDEDTWERVVGSLLGGLSGEEGGDEDDEEKPVWDDEDYGDYEEKENDVGEESVLSEIAAADEDGPINMDADFIGFEPEKKKRKKGKKGKGVEENQAEEQDLTVADRAKKVKQALEEYKALDHEDMIEDLPTRFHYTKSAPLAYGLSPAEILLATDTELNQIMSVKHIAPYRSGGLGMAGKGLGKRVRDLKDSLKERRWGEEYVPAKEDKGQGRERARDSGWPKKEGEEGPKKKRMGKNERKRKAALNGDAEPGGVEVQGVGSYPVPTVTPHAPPRDSLPENAITVSSEGPKKKRKKRKHGTAEVA